MIHLQGDKRHHRHGIKCHHLDGVKRHHLQGTKLHHLQGVKLHHLQGAKLHHRQGAKLQLLSKQEWRPNIIYIKRRQETRIFIDKHPLMSFATIKRIQDIVKGIFATKTKNS